MSNPLLKVSGLKIGATVYPPDSKPHKIEIVHGVDFELQKGKVLGLIGESGAGKSTIGLSALGYGRGGVELTGGEVWVNGRDILQGGIADLRKLRGAARKSPMWRNPPLQVSIPPKKSWIRWLRPPSARASSPVQMPKPKRGSCSPNSACLILTTSDRATHIRSAVANYNVA
ncbi:peptide/nickel/opine uptake family ABC transporter, ATP-binding protein [Rhodobacteraceae bacterium HTCC2083]|nr:peptide/nickel/opine uptake family ABC transporter, ATP-binding protein [Rhodobacteraceae bacterium HTCC2083]